MKINTTMSLVGTLTVSFFRLIMLPITRFQDVFYLAVWSKNMDSSSVIPGHVKKILSFFAITIFEYNYPLK